MSLRDNDDLLPQWLIGSDKLVGCMMILMDLGSCVVVKKKKNTSRSQTRQYDFGIWMKALFLITNYCLDRISFVSRLKSIPSLAIQLECGLASTHQFVPR
jgi:hypothetical protein